MWKQPGLITARAVELAVENNRLAGADGIPEPNDDDVVEAEEWVRARYKAAMMLSGADNKRYKSLKNYLENRFAINKSDEYPVDTSRLLGQMKNYRAEGTWNGRVVPKVESDDEDGPSFLQQGGEEEGEEPDQEQVGANFLQRRAVRWE